MNMDEQYEDPFVEQILLLCAVHQKYEKEELKAKYYGLKKHVPRFLVRQLDSVGAETDENALRALAIVSKNADDLETTQMCLDKLIDCTMTSEEPSKELDLLELNVDLCAILLEMGKLSEVKVMLKDTNFVYQQLKTMNDERKKSLVKYLGRREVDFDAKFAAQQIGLLKNYEQYYAAKDDQTKVVHNGVLVLKYQLKCNAYDPVEWAEHAVHLSPYCCEIRAFRRSHYMLRVAEVLLALIKEDIKVNPSLQKLNKSRYLEGRIKYGFAQHCLTIIYETKNVYLIKEKIKSGAMLTTQQKQDMHIDPDVTEFEELSVPEGDKRLDGLMTNATDVREVYDKTKKLMRDVTNLLTEDERNAIGYELVAEKMKELLNAFPYLNSD